MARVTAFSLWLYLLLAVYRAESMLTLSPSGTARVCPGGALTIRCSTDRTFLNWNVTIPPSTSESGQAITRSRLIASSIQSGISPLVVDMKTFNISIVSAVERFTSVLSVINVTADLNGTIVQCTDIGSSVAESRTLMTIVHIIQTDAVYSNPLGVKTETVIFGIDDITTTLSWTQQEPADMDLNVSVIPQVPFSQGFGNITLRLSYNIVYFVSIAANVCQVDVSSTTIMLNYVKCENVLHELGPDHSNIQVVGYSDPALEGASVTLECTSPNLVQIGPNTTTCMGNGEWEPDPREVACIADCGVPLVHSSLNLTYNSTLEGSMLVVLCDGFETEAFCHRNGSWSPELTDNVCHLMITDPASHNNVATQSYNIIIVISVAISAVVFLAVSVVVIACILLCRKYVLSASKALPDGTTATYQQTQPVYETVMESTTVDLEMTENVAYGPIHTLKKNINTS